MEEMVKERSAEASGSPWPAPHPELRRLEPLIGRWTQKGHSKDTIFGPGVPYTSEENFYWLEGGHFLVQTYNTRFGTEPAQKGINYWYYDADAKSFHIIFFSNNGPFTEEGNRYRGVVEGDQLTFTGSRPLYGTGSMNSGRIATTADGSIESQWLPSRREVANSVRGWTHD